jgi:hypothetical protein
VTIDVQRTESPTLVHASELRRPRRIGSVKGTCKPQPPRLRRSEADACHLIGERIVRDQYATAMGRISGWCRAARLRGRPRRPVAFRVVNPSMMARHMRVRVGRSAARRRGVGVAAVKRGGDTGDKRRVDGQPSIHVRHPSYREAPAAQNGQKVGYYRSVLAWMVVGCCVIRE